MASARFILPPEGWIRTGSDGADITPVRGVLQQPVCNAAQSGAVEPSIARIDCPGRGGLSRIPWGAGSPRRAGPGHGAPSGSRSWTSRREELPALRLDLALFLRGAGLLLRDPADQRRGRRGRRRGQPAVAVDGHARRRDADRIRPSPRSSRGSRACNSSPGHTGFCAEFDRLLFLLRGATGAEEHLDSVASSTSGWRCSACSCRRCSGRS